MTPRLYANPFVREAASASIVARSDWNYSGLSGVGREVFRSYSRTVRYSDGSELTDHELRPV